MAHSLANVVESRDDKKIVEELYELVCELEKLKNELWVVFANPTH